ISTYDFSAPRSAPAAGGTRCSLYGRYPAGPNAGGAGAVDGRFGAARPEAAAAGTWQRNAACRAPLRARSRGADGQLFRGRAASRLPVGRRTPAAVGGV